MSANCVNSHLLPDGEQVVTSGRLAA